MEVNQIVGYFLAVLVGITLGLIGSGGSILSVPILVYVMHIEPLLATAYSLFTVGTTALVGGINRIKAKEVDFSKVFFFGIPAVTAVFFTRNLILPALPETICLASFCIEKSLLIMIVFAAVMLVASLKMILPAKVAESDSSESSQRNRYMIIIPALFIGLLAGFVGAGGGFLIIPVLIFYEKLPMKKAVGTSLFIIALQSLLGFTGDLKNNPPIDWSLLLLFTCCSVVGIFIGILLSKKINGSKLKTAFGWFVLVMGIYIIIKETFLK